MADYTKNARSSINGYMWQEIVSAGILVPSDYNPDGFIETLVPIIPSQQVPEFNNLLPNRTYIVYDYEVDGYSDDWWMCYESMMYTIVSPEYSKIIEVSEFLVDLFRRFDISGMEVQNYNKNKDIVKFYSVSLESVSSPGPSDLESGRAAGIVEISYKYSRVVGNDGRFV